MSRYTTVPRPTERAAIASAGEPSLPPIPVLFSRLVVAQAIGDRHGRNLFAHAIARQGGERGE
ncbi:hypothetical protein OG252_26355 [Streptomyces sp. NBC_01352]|uniref:hypothetical protein n=1 Tax=Streptomyces sp. NBC_01352 TaxID=2903834 RepID=UPI002E2EB435|nr:hypothetical protein [Streptomyces sp. NBC_01352]